MKVIVESDRCTGCGACEESCPVGAARVVDGIASISEDCTICGICVDACSVGALSLPAVGTGSTEEAASYRGIWVYAEWRHGKVHRVTYELLTKGRMLAEKRGVPLAAVILGHRLGEHAEALFRYGAEVVYVVDHPSLAHFTDDVYGSVMAHLVRRYRPEVLLAGATSVGRSFIPRVAALLKTGLTADCTDLDVNNDGLLVQTRPAFGGNIMASILCPYGRPQMATVRPRVMSCSELPEPKRGRIEAVEVPEHLLRSRIEVLEERASEGPVASIVDADVIIAGGRGLQKREHFTMIEELAALFKGAVGASRGAVEAGFADPSQQVGQTGRTVAPVLYVAIGISGAVQHVVGMQGSQVIVAVNKDPQAPIFDVCHYGVVADLFEFVPALIRRVRDVCGYEPTERF